MANIQYADPFGSYTRGAQAGQEAVINQGMAARRFRAADLSPEVQAWYLPFKQREMAATTGTGELNLNEALGQNAARLTALGPQGDNYYRAFLAKQYGFDPNLIQGGGPDQQSQQIDLQRRAGEASGATPYGVYDPLFASVGHYGYSKEQQLTPEQYQQRMNLQYGPDWQSRQGGAPSANGYNSYTNPNASPWIQRDTPTNQPIDLRNPTQSNSVQPNPTGGAGGVSNDYSNFLVHPGNVPGYNNTVTRSGQDGQPALAGDTKGPPL